MLESQAQHFYASRKLYSHALRLNPKLSAAYYNLGNDLLKQKQYRKAIREYDKVLKLYPTDPWALQNRELAGKSANGRTRRRLQRVREIDLSPAARAPG